MQHSATMTKWQTIQQHPVLAWILAMISGLLTAVLYFPTVHPGVGPYLDSVEYQTAVYQFGITHPPGYPLYLFFGKLFTAIPFNTLGLAPAFGDNFAWRLNLMSLFMSAFTVVIVARIIQRLTNNALFGAVGAMFLATAVRFWYLGTYAEIYSSYGLFVSLAFYTLIVWMQTAERRYYFLSVLFFSLCFCLNAPAIWLVPAWVIGVLLTDWRMMLSPKNFLKTAGIVLLCASIYLYIPLRSLVWGPPAFCNYCPESWADIPAFLTGEVWREQSVTFGNPPKYWLQRSADSGGELMLNFWPIGVLLGGIGMADLYRRAWRIAVTLTLAVLGAWMFVITLNVVDWMDFMAGTYVLFAPFVGVGLWAVWNGMMKATPYPNLLTYLGRMVLVLGAIGIIVASAVNNRPLVETSPNHNMFWHWQSRDLLTEIDALDDSAWVLMPPIATDGFVVSWAVRFVSWTESLAEDATFIFSPIAENPPGPEPGYIAWEDAKDRLQERPLYLLELNDERIDDWILQPVMNGEYPVGYRVVGEMVENEPISWITADEFEGMRETFIYPEKTE